MKKFLLLFCFAFSLQAFSQCYSVTQITYAPDSFNLGTSIPVMDDQYSNPIQMPFSFCFFGNVYNQVLVGANGVIQFDTSLAGGYCQWPVATAIPSVSDPVNAIFFPWQDLFWDSTYRFYYNVYGAAPNRKFVLSIYHSPMYSCVATKFFTGEVMLYETTNVIEMHIQRKDLCISWNGGYAIEGIQNSSGTQAAVVPGRNFPTQWTASNDAWRFSPNCCPLGVHSFSQEPALTIYPNPASGSVNIRYENAQQEFSVELTDNLGRLIAKDNLSRESQRTFSLAGIAPGIYFIRIVSESGAILETEKQEIL